MNQDSKLTPEQEEAVLRELKEICETGMLDPVLRFNPEGFDLPFVYTRGNARSVPIPEFRVYSQQFLTLLAIVLFARNDLLPETVVRLRSYVEPAEQTLTMVLLVELQLSAARLSSAQESPLNSVGTAFSGALRTLFADLDIIFWGHDLNTGFAKFWTKYPGQMTIAGFERTINEAHVAFASSATLELPPVTYELHLRATAVLKFILDDSAPGS